MNTSTHTTKTPIKRTYVFYTDPGHAWLKVPMSELYALNLQRQISSYSYCDGFYAYLEEDCDAPCFLNAIKALDLPFEIRDKYTDGQSPVRELPHYQSVNQLN